MGLWVADVFWLSDEWEESPLVSGGVSGSSLRRGRLRE
jgi:hypothetical protein